MIGAILALGSAVLHNMPIGHKAVPKVSGFQANSTRASVELVADKFAIRPGESFTVAVHMTLPTGWHAYYINPGESGAPPRIAWQLPRGVIAGNIQWPTPERLTQGGVAGNVYTNDVWLPVQIQTGTTLMVGSTLRLRAKLSWLLCRETCIPDSAELNLTVRVATRTEPDPFHAPAIQKAVLAVPAPWDGPKATALLVGKSIQLTLPGLTMSQAPRFFAADPDFFGADETLFSPTTGAAVISIPLSRYATGIPTHLEGIVAPANSRPFRINIPIKKDTNKT